MENTPHIATKAPAKVTLEEGKDYWYCTCGLSANQPFCDGSHAGTGLSPLAFEAKESKTVYFCGCKATGKSPRCDGSHRNLP